MATWILILTIGAAGRFGAPPVALPGYETEAECSAAGEAARKMRGPNVSVDGWICIPGPRHAHH